MRCYGSHSHGPWREELRVARRIGGFASLFPKMGDSKPIFFHFLDDFTPVDRWFIPLFIGLQPSKVMQDFFHPQYDCAVTHFKNHESL
jgi:hypothetical protein